MSDYFEDLLALHHEGNNAIDTMGSNRESILNKDVHKEETNQLHGVSLSDCDLLDLSQLVKVVNQPVHD